MSRTELYHLRKYIYCLLKTFLLFAHLARYKYADITGLDDGRLCWRPFPPFPTTLVRSQFSVKNAPQTIPTYLPLFGVIWIARHGFWNLRCWWVGSEFCVIRPKLWLGSSGDWLGPFILTSFYRCEIIFTILLSWFFLNCNLKIGLSIFISKRSIRKITSW